MGYEWISGLIVLGGLAVFMLGGMMLTRPGWLLGWLRGCAGLLLIGIAIMLGVFAVNLFNYKVDDPDSPVLTLDVRKDGEQLYRVVMTDAEGREQVRDIAGDLWQIDVRVIEWSGIPYAVGFRTGYRSEQLQGRYVTYEQEIASDRRPFPLSEPDMLFDTWPWLQALSVMVDWIRVYEHSTRFVPLADVARYKVMLGSDGLIVRPANAEAEAALNAWQ